MKFLDFIKKYKVYLIVIGILAVGVFYKRNVVDKAAKANKITERKSTEPRTIMVHMGLHNKTKEEKREYILNHFDMDYIIGNKNAKITIIEYSSFTCKYCKKMRGEINKILDEYTSDENSQVRYVIRPIYNTKTIPLGAFLACAKDEDKLNIIDDFFKTDLGVIANMEEFLLETGKKYNMDETYVKDCIYNKDMYEKLIYMQQASRSVFNLDATPVFVINGKEYIGYRTSKQLKTIVENILNNKGKN